MQDIDGRFFMNNMEYRLVNCDHCGKEFFRCLNNPGDFFCDFSCEKKFKLLQQSKVEVKNFIGRDLASRLRATYSERIRKNIISRMKGVVEQEVSHENLLG